MVQVKDLLSGTFINRTVNICGWVRTKRVGKNISFLSINDGSTLKNIQCVVDLSKIDSEVLECVSTGTSVSVSGELIKSVGEGQDFEIVLSDLKVLGSAVDFPVQQKKHSMEFLRSVSHLRFRTNTFNAVFRVRNAICFAIHEFFQSNNFIYLNTPIITGNDAEGAGDTFTVTTLDIDGNKNNFENDFFGKHVNLTVSGQLEAETAIFGLGKVYTFGPTFRAENSNTTRHLAEFWMVEPEMSFYNLDDNIKLAEDFLKFVVKRVCEKCNDEILFLDNRLRMSGNGEILLNKLNNVIEKPFTVITYSEAFDILKQSEENKCKKFSYVLENWGCDLQSEHEKFLVEQYFQGPVVVRDYPSDIKAFYMKQNDDKKTVAAMDVLFPGIGEIIGGSQREENFERLVEAINKRGIDAKTLDWYLDTRRFGSIVHSGFGLGLERLVLFMTGMDNIRDVIPFPRYPKHADF